MIDQKIKTAALKAILGLVPLRAIFGVARVFGYGAKKYAPGNYLTATLADGAGQRYVSAALRHLSEMQEPNGLHTPESLAALDAESGLPHIDHVLAGMMMLRAIMVKEGALAADPGEGNEPIAIARTKSPDTVRMMCLRCLGEPRGELVANVDGTMSYSRCPKCNPIIPANEREGY